MFTKIKRWLNEFDIKPKPPVVGSLLDATHEFIEQANFQAAISELKKILYLNRNNKTALATLSKLYLDCSQYKNCQNTLRLGLKYYPNEPLFLRYYGTLLYLQGKTKASIQALTQALALEPEHETTRHLLQSAKGDTSQNTDLQYVKSLFDYYADDFEKSLKRLGYCAPSELINYLKQEIDSKFKDILELGCGTGLVGEQMQQHLAYNKLVGLDLSSQMLTQASKKQIYTELIESDLLEYLTVNQNPYDLIVSADVFMYIGELTQLFALVHKNLTTNGYFAFTVEDSPKENFSIDITGRFKHNPQYIKNILQQVNLQLIAHKQAALRYERGQPVMCSIYLAVKS